MRKRFLTFFVSLMLLAGLDSAARAEPANESGAQKLKSIFENQIRYQKVFTGLGEKATLEFDGNVTVEPSGDFYAVTLPYVKIVYPNGNHLDLGMISINASAHEIPGQWKMSAAIPTPLVMFDSADRQVMRLSIGGQRFAGIWDEGLEYFAKLDANYKDVAIESATPLFSHKISEVQARYDFAKDETGKWSGPGFVALIGTTINFNNGVTTGSIGEIKARFDLDRYDPVALTDYREKLMAMAENQSNTAAPVSGNHVTALYNMVLDAITNTGNGFTSEYSIKDVNIIHPRGTVKMGNGYLGLDLSGFSTDQVKLSSRFGYNKFSIIPPPPGYEDLQPENMNLDVTIENLPFKQLAELGRNTLQAGLAGPEASQLAGLSLMIKLPAIMAQAGTFMTFKDNHVGNNLYKVDLNGTVRSDISAVNSFTANARATFVGLDKVLAKAQVQGANPNNKDAKSFRELSRTLEILKSVAKTETNENQQFVHVFEFTVNPQGQMLLNGQDFMTLMSTPSAAP